MTLRTASVTGNWSDTATWGGNPVPVNADTFAINSGVIVTYDADQSGMAAGMGASTITGTLRFKRAAGTYILKLNGNLTGTGVIDASDGAGGSYAAGQTAQITLNTTAITITLTGIQNVICLEPVHQYAKVTADAAIAATVLSIDTDVTGEPTYWKNGDLVRVSNAATNESEQYTISSVSSTTITLTSGLIAAKPTGSYVSLVTRNVKIVGQGTGGSATAFVTPANTSILSAEIRSVNIGINTANLCTIGGSITATTSALATVAGTMINAAIVSAGNALNACTNCQVRGIIAAYGNALTASNNITLFGIVAGGTNGSNGSICEVVGGTVSGNTTGISNGGGYIFRNAILTNNTRDVQNLSRFTAYNTLFGSATEFLNYNSTLLRKLWDYAESFDHDQVVGAYRNWCLGGITSSNLITVYPGRVQSYKHVLESATAYAFRDQIISVPAGGWINVRCFIQKDASMSYLPRVQIFDAAKEPLISGSADAETQMTNSTNTWEVLFAKFQNSATMPKFYKVRVIASNAANNVYEDTDISVSPFGFALGAS